MLDLISFPLLGEGGDKTVTTLQQDLHMGTTTELWTPLILHLRREALRGLPNSLPNYGHVPRPDYKCLTPSSKQSLLIMRQTKIPPLSSKHCSYSSKLQGHNVEARLLSNPPSRHPPPANQVGKEERGGLDWARVEEGGRWAWSTATSSSGWSHKSAAL